VSLILLDCSCRVVGLVLRWPLVGGTAGNKTHVHGVCLGRQAIEGGGCWLGSVGEVGTSLAGPGWAVLLAISELLLCAASSQVPRHPAVDLLTSKLQLDWTPSPGVMAAS
jgi:hypothetical protein